MYGLDSYDCMAIHFIKIMTNAEHIYNSFERSNESTFANKSEILTVLSQFITMQICVYPFYIIKYKFVRDSKQWDKHLSNTSSKENKCDIYDDDMDLKYSSYAKRWSHKLLTKLNIDWRQSGTNLIGDNHINRT